MSIFKKTFAVSTVTLFVATLFLVFCGGEGTPAYCGDGHPYNETTQFCFNGETHDKCGTLDYDPTVRFCADDNTLHNRCGNATFVPATQFCDRHTVYQKCGGREFDPTEYRCVSGNIEVIPTNFPVTVVSEMEDAAGGRNYDVGTIATISAGNNTETRRFTNWTTESAGVTFTDPNNPVTTFIMPRNEVVVTANFEDIPIEYDLTVNANPQTGGIVTPSGTATHNAGTTINVTATAAAGFTFIEWSGDVPESVNEKESRITFDIDTTMTLIANFLPDSAVGPFNITNNVIPERSGSITRDPEQSSYERGTRVALTAKPSDGYEFVNWTGDMPSTSSTITLDIYSDLTINANFRPFYTLTIDTLPKEGGEVKVVPRQATYYLNDRVTVEAEPADGYRFVSWTGTAVPSAVTTNPMTITMDANKELNANFVRIYPVTVTSTGAGATGSGVYAQGDTVTINAGDAPTNHRFVNWTSTSEGVTFLNANSATTTFIMPDNAVTVTANFEIITYTVTFNANGGTVNPTSLQARIGQRLNELPIPTPTRSGANWTGWGTAQTGGTIHDGSHIVTGDITLYARWTISETQTHNLTDDGSHTIDFVNKSALSGMETTIEVWAIGGGGGGQGGGRVYQNTSGLSSSLRCTGASGGGGGGEHFSHNVPAATTGVTFNVKIGAGGSGGASYEDSNWFGIGNDNRWTAGDQGSPGEETTVSWWDGHWLIGYGGHGGRGGREWSEGGAGGTGRDGGGHSGCPGGSGGNAGTSSTNGVPTRGGNRAFESCDGSGSGGVRHATGTPTPAGRGGGGAGGHNHGNSDSRGFDGGPGIVIVRVTYQVDL